MTVFTGNVKTAFATLQSALEAADLDALDQRTAVALKSLVDDTIEKIDIAVAELDALLAPGSTLNLDRMVAGIFAVDAVTLLNDLKGCAQQLVDLLDLRAFVKRVSVLIDQAAVRG